MAKTFLTKKNNAKSTITDNPLTSGATTVNVQSGDGAKFPTAPFHATLYTSDPSVGEIVKVTAKSTDAFTIERAKENTTAQEWAQNTRIELLVTAKLFDDFQIRTEVIVATDGSGDYNCDGTDDQTEINEAISDLPAGGCIVRLKKGTYTLTGLIQILNENCWLTGARLDCLKVIGTEESIIRNCFIHDNTGTGIGLFTNSQHNTITGNVLTSNGYGVYDSACNYNNFSGNVS